MTQTESTLAAHERGWRAAECGKTLRDCPFPRASAEAVAWRNGFRRKRRRLTKAEQAA